MKHVEVLVKIRQLALLILGDLDPYPPNPTRQASPPPNVRRAFKRQIMEEDTPRILRKDRPLSRDASFLLIFLCQECAHADPQDELVVVTRAQIDEFLSAYRQDDDGDQAKFDRRVTAAIRQLQDLRLLNQDPDADYLYTISPVVVPLVGVDELTRLEAAYRLGAGATANDGNGTENSAQLLDEES
ncbi:DUF4194 domain-containing protein (plasmid) [Microbacterium paraoxydans]|nr:DUF4194 domain-containing protein [Microbacterium paraoxydans]